MTNKEAVNWLINLMSDIGKSEHSNLWHYEQALMEIRELLESEPHWIPCKEKLPEVHESGDSISGLFMKSKPILVYGVPEYEENADFHVVTYCDDLDGNTYWSTELDAVTINGVTAWMPLPEPYKGDTDGTP